MKRATFNGRPISRFQKLPTWDYLGQSSQSTGECLVALEAELDKLDKNFETAFRSEQTRARNHLLAVVDEPDFARGLTMASPDLVRGIERLRRGKDQRGRKERKAEASLWRYTTRTALKPSPFASLTRIAAGELIDKKPSAPQRRLAASLRTRGYLRVQRYVLSQLWHVLRARSEVLDVSQIFVEPSARCLEGKRWRLIRPPGWRIGETMSFRPSGLVDVRLAGPLVEHLAEACQQPRPFDELRSYLGETRNEEQLKISLAGVQRLIDIGFLRQDPPWSTFEPIAEQALAEWAHSVTGLEQFSEALDEQIRLQRADRQRPGYLRSLNVALNAMWQTATDGLDPAPALARVKMSQFYEDTVALPNATESSQPAVCLDARAIGEVLTAAAPYARYLDLFDRRHDVHRTVASILERDFKSETVPILESFAACWPAVSKILGSSPGIDALPGTDSRAELNSLRRSATEVLHGSIRSDGAGESVIDPRLLELRLNDLGLPSWTGGTWFVQPTNADGRCFVLHRAEVATGRHFARFVPLFGGDQAARWCRRAIERRPRRIDIPNASYDTLNAHAVQTPFVLDSPLESAGGGAEQVPLDSLSIRHCGAGMVEVVDAAGRIFEPVHLGGAEPRFAQRLQFFLTLLGPGSSGQSGDPMLPWDSDGPECNDRWLLGQSLVVRRRRFVVNVADHADRLAKSDECAAFRMVDVWRRQASLPRRCYWLEQRTKGGSKPQYLDFSSPPAVAALVSGIVSGTSGKLVFEEALPDPTSAWLDGDGKGWIVEFSIDESVLGPEITWSPERSNSP